ncbi:hypothetical protein ACWEOI_34740 [Nocardia sp. NPDC004340]
MASAAMKRERSDIGAVGPFGSMVAVRMERKKHCADNTLLSAATT